MTLNCWVVRLVSTLVISALLINLVPPLEGSPLPFFPIHVAPVFVQQAINPSLVDVIRPVDSPIAKSQVARDVFTSASRIRFRRVSRFVGLFFGLPIFTFAAQITRDSKGWLIKEGNTYSDLLSNFGLHGAKYWSRDGRFYLETWKEFWAGTARAGDVHMRIFAGERLTDQQYERLRGIVTHANESLSSHPGQAVPDLVHQGASTIHVIAPSQPIQTISATLDKTLHLQTPPSITVPYPVASPGHLFSHVASWFSQPVHWEYLAIGAGFLAVSYVTYRFGKQGWNAFQAWAGRVKLRRNSSDQEQMPSETPPVQLIQKAILIDDVSPGIKETDFDELLKGKRRARAAELSYAPRLQRQGRTREKAIPRGVLNQDNRRLLAEANKNAAVPSERGRRKIRKNTVTSGPVSKADDRNGVIARAPSQSQPIVSADARASGFEWVATPGPQSAEGDNKSLSHARDNRRAVDGVIVRFKFTTNEEAPQQVDSSNGNPLATTRGKSLTALPLLQQRLLLEAGPSSRSREKTTVPSSRVVTGKALDQLLLDLDPESQLKEPLIDFNEAHARLKQIEIQLRLLHSAHISRADTRYLNAKLGVATQTLTMWYDRRRAVPSAPAPTRAQVLAALPPAQQRLLLEAAPGIMSKEKSREVDASLPSPDLNRHVDGAVDDVVDRPHSDKIEQALQTVLQRPSDIISPKTASASIGSVLPSLRQNEKAPDLIVPPQGPAIQERTESLPLVIRATVGAVEARLKPIHAQFQNLRWEHVARASTLYFETARAIIDGERFPLLDGIRTMSRIIGSESDGVFFAIFDEICSAVTTNASFLSRAGQRVDGSLRRGQPVVKKKPVTVLRSRLLNANEDPDVLAIQDQTIPVIRKLIIGDLDSPGHRPDYSAPQAQINALVERLKAALVSNGYSAQERRAAELLRTATFLIIAREKQQADQQVSSETTGAASGLTPKERAFVKENALSENLPRSDQPQSLRFSPRVTVYRYSGDIGTEMSGRVSGLRQRSALRELVPFAALLPANRPLPPRVALEMALAYLRFLTVGSRFKHALYVSRPAQVALAAGARSVQVSRYFFNGYAHLGLTVERSSQALVLYTPLIRLVRPLFRRRGSRRLRPSPAQTPSFFQAPPALGAPAAPSVDPVRFSLASQYVPIKMYQVREQALADRVARLREQIKTAVPDELAARQADLNDLRVEASRHFPTSLLLQTVLAATDRTWVTVSNLWHVRLISDAQQINALLKTVTPETLSVRQRQVAALQKEANAWATDSSAADHHLVVLQQGLADAQQRLSGFTNRLQQFQAACRTLTPEAIASQRAELATLNAFASQWFPGSRQISMQLGRMNVVFDAAQGQLNDFVKRLNDLRALIPGVNPQTFDPQVARINQLSEEARQRYPSSITLKHDLLEAALALDVARLRLNDEFMERLGRFSQRMPLVTFDTLAQAYTDWLDLETETNQYFAAFPAIRETLAQARRDLERASARIDQEQKIDFMRRLETLQHRLLEAVPLTSQEIEESGSPAPFISLRDQFRTLQKESAERFGGLHDEPLRTRLHETSEILQNTKSFHDRLAASKERNRIRIVGNPSTLEDVPATLYLLHANIDRKTQYLNDSKTLTEAVGDHSVPALLAWFEKIYTDLFLIEQHVNLLLDRKQAALTSQLKDALKKSRDQEGHPLEITPTQEEAARVILNDLQAIDDVRASFPKEMKVVRLDVQNAIRRLIEAGSGLTSWNIGSPAGNIKTPTALPFWRTLEQAAGALRGQSDFDLKVADFRLRWCYLEQWQRLQAEQLAMSHNPSGMVAGTMDWTSTQPHKRLGIIPVDGVSRRRGDSTEVLKSTRRVEYEFIGLERNLWDSLYEQLQRTEKEIKGSKGTQGKELLDPLREHFALFFKLQHQSSLNDDVLPESMRDLRDPGLAQRTYKLLATLSTIGGKKASTSFGDRTSLVIDSEFPQWESQVRDLVDSVLPSLERQRKAALDPYAHELPSVEPAAVDPYRIPTDPLMAWTQLQTQCHDTVIRTRSEFEKTNAVDVRIQAMLRWIELEDQRRMLDGALLAPDQREEALNRMTRAQGLKADEANPYLLLSNSSLATLPPMLQESVVAADEALDVLEKMLWNDLVMRVERFESKINDGVDAIDPADVTGLRLELRELTQAIPHRTTRLIRSQPFALRAAHYQFVYGGRQEPGRRKTNQSEMALQDSLRLRIEKIESALDGRPLPDIQFRLEAETPAAKTRELIDDLTALKAEMLQVIREQRWRWNDSDLLNWIEMNRQKLNTFGGAALNGAGPIINNHPEIEALSYDITNVLDSIHTIYLKQGYHITPPKSHPLLPWNDEQRAKIKTFGLVLGALTALAKLTAIGLLFYGAASAASGDYSSSPNPWGPSVIVWVASGLIVIGLSKGAKAWASSYWSRQQKLGKIITSSTGPRPVRLHEDPILKDIEMLKVNLYTIKTQPSSLGVRSEVFSAVEHYLETLQLFFENVRLSPASGANQDPWVALEQQFKALTVLINGSRDAVTGPTNITERGLVKRVMDVRGSVNLLLQTSPALADPLSVSYRQARSSLISDLRFPSSFNRDNITPWLAYVDALYELVNSARNNKGVPVSVDDANYFAYLDNEYKTFNDIRSPFNLDLLSAELQTPSFEAQDLNLDLFKKFLIIGSDDTRHVAALKTFFLEKLRLSNIDDLSSRHLVDTVNMILSSRPDMRSLLSLARDVYPRRRALFSSAWETFPKALFMTIFPKETGRAPRPFQAVREFRTTATLSWNRVPKAKQQSWWARLFLSRTLTIRRDRLESQAA